MSAADYYREAGSSEEFVFTGGQTGHNADGKLVLSFDELDPSVRQELKTGFLLIDAPERRVLPQTWQALQNLEDTLRKRNSSLTQVAHLRVFLRDPQHYRGVVRVLSSVFGDALPSATIVGATAPGIDPRVDVQLDAVALHGDCRPSHRSLDALGRLTTPFPNATVAGSLVFTTPVGGVDPATGLAVNSFERLSPQDAANGRANCPDPWSEAAVAEHIALWRNVRTVLEAVGSDFSQLIRQCGWLGQSLQEYAPTAHIRKHIISAQNISAMSAFPMSWLPGRNATNLFGVIAVSEYGLATGAERHNSPTAHGVGPYYVPASRTRDVIFPAGEVPINTEIPQHINGFDDLELALKPRLNGRIVEEVDNTAQTHFIYDKISDTLAAHGASLDDVVHQTVYLTHPYKLPAVERVATMFFGPTLPSTTVVPIAGTSPYAEASVEIEVTAVRPHTREA
ncbi:RidA family protein [Sciscionella sediminilitoris]|uniref:RidA family protein n=1 Tax=Sciscionella sediminilitoris TaxID=1445613 RepID=UPI0004DF4110|nr:RidA family protein [Sciscionella sp. SE31]